MTVISFDTWRERYDRMTFREHQEYNAGIALEYPIQRQWHPDGVAQFLNERWPAKVVELGGWDGSLAREMLPHFPDIRTWVNYDITPNVPQVCDDPRYHQVTLIDWPWNCRITGDVLIASHVFEHMKLNEIDRTVRTWDVGSIYADVPIGTHEGWQGYEGTHIIDGGADEFVEVVEAAGFCSAQEFNYGLAKRHGDIEPYGLVAFFDREAA